MNELITADIIMAGCILIIGMVIGVVCIRGIKAGENRGLTGIITTTSKGDLCGLPGAVETDGLGEIGRRSGRGKPGPEPPIPLGLPESRDGSERPVFKIKACCLICANGKPKEGAVLCTYSKGAYREGWYCGLFMQRDIETRME